VGNSVITVLPKKKVELLGDGTPKGLGELIITAINPEPVKALMIISVTEFGIIIDSNEVQFWKALSPIVIIDSGICTKSNSVQFLKVLLLILVTESGINIDISLIQPKKALGPIL
jgi:hypothetical protein